MDIRRFVTWNKLPGEDRTEKRRKIKKNLAEAMQPIFLITGAVFAMVDGIAWLLVIFEGEFLCQALALMVVTILFFGAWIAAKTWEDVL